VSELYQRFDFTPFQPALLRRADVLRHWRRGRSGEYYRAPSNPEEEGLAPFIEHLEAVLGVPASRLQLDFLCTPVGGELLPHLDDMHMYEKQYLIMLQQAEVGGILHLHPVNSGPIPVPTSAGQCISFDANSVVHSVSKVEKGERYVLSVWTLPARD
jgi:hypothetical protein